MDIGGLSMPAECDYDRAVILGPRMPQVA